MIEKISDLKFLRDITDRVVSEKQLSLFKNMIKIYEVADKPEIQFRIASDWEGNWITGNWYLKQKIVTSPDELLMILSKNNVANFIYNLDLINEISCWRNSRFITPINYIQIEHHISY